MNDNNPLEFDEIGALTEIYRQLVQKEASNAQISMFEAAYSTIRDIGLVETLKSPDYLNMKTAIKGSDVTPAKDGIAHIVLELNPKYKGQSAEEIASRFDMKDVKIITQQTEPNYYRLFLQHDEGDVVVIDLYKKPQIRVPVPNKTAGGFLPYGGGGYGMPGSF